MISRIFYGEDENDAVKRKRQIDTLKIFNDNVSELQEDVEYQVQFDAGDTRMAILVSLSPKFPLEKPVLRVSPPIIHPWCNEHSEIISAPGLLNFTIHSDLGRVVQAIIREFSKNPPRLVDDNLLSRVALDMPGRSSPLIPPNLYYVPHNYNIKQFVSPPTTYFGNNFSNQVLGTGQQQFFGPNKLKNSSSSDFPELINLSTEELQRLANDDDRLEEFLESLDQIKELDTAVEDYINLIEKTASSNLSREEELKKLKEEVTSEIQRFDQEKARYDQLVERHDELARVFSPTNIRDRLSEAADRSQEQSEKIADDFLNRKIDVERFLSSYIECRKLGQARRTKEEKLTHQLNELEK